MAARGAKYNGKNVIIQARTDGSRQYYEHDDRGGDRGGDRTDRGDRGGDRSDRGDRAVSRGGGSGGGRGNFRHYNSGGKFRGGGARAGRVWEGGWDEERGNRLPDGHWRGGRRGGGRGGGPRRSHYKDDDTEMSGPREKNRRQDQYKRRGGRPHHHMNHANNRMGWHKMMIRDGGNLDRQEVMEGIRSLVHEPFIPILYELDGKFLVFYLEDNAPAVQAISEVSRRLTMANGARLSIFCNRSPPPSRPLIPEQREQVMKVMSERYSPEMKRLDLKNFHNDTTLVKENIFCPLYRQPNVQIVVDIILQNIPLVEEIDLAHNKINCLNEMERLVPACACLRRLSLKKNKLPNVETLDKLTGALISDLTLEDNPLCDRFRDTETYIRQVHWATDPG